jgi:hypothetical protein
VKYPPSENEDNHRPAPGGEGKRQIALIAVHPAREIDRCAMAAVLLHLQADIAHRNLLAIFMLKKSTLSAICSFWTSYDQPRSSGT